MTAEQIATSKYLLGKIGRYERSEVLSRFDSIPQKIRQKVLDTLSAKEKELQEKVPVVVGIGGFRVKLGEFESLDEKKIAEWAENNLPWLDGYLRPLEFSRMREAVMRATGPA